MRKGFTLIELLAVIVILAVIALIATPIILGIISNAKKEAFKDTAYGIIDAAKNEYIKEMYSSQAATDITFTYANNVESSDVIGKSLSYSGTKPQDGIVLLTSSGNVAIAVYDGTLCAYKSYSDSEVTVEEIPLSECITEYSASKGVNIPELAQGMTPIKWDGSKWIDTSISDKDWYDYTNKKWANARTADGSMWVWIPRYIYKIKPITEGDINSGWHKSTAGIIDVQFSKGTNDNWNNGTIGNIDTGTASSSSNNKWTNQPGFTFGGTELTGIWVAKFEATAIEGITNGYTVSGSCVAGDNVTTKTIKILPNVQSWRCMQIGSMFTNIRNMETKSVYGWDIASGLQADGSFTNDANNIDTHLIKNIEWGVVAYLSKSNYGQGENEIWINPANNFTTGCAGDSVSSGETTGCLRTYETSNGQKTSTTANLYGIYDISGGSWEYVSAYVDNGQAGSGASIIGSLLKYKDLYTVTTDNGATNYSNAAGKKGDSVYEISDNINGLYSWFGDWNNMPNAGDPWFTRGSRFNDGSAAGAFYFAGYWGGSDSRIGFRPVIVVALGL